MAASLLVAATLALAGCGSSSTVTINQQPSQPLQPEPELEQEPQTGGGSDGGTGLPPQTQPTTGDGDDDTDSGDTTTTGDGGQTITQQQQQQQQPEPQTGGGGSSPQPQPQPQPGPEPQPNSPPAATAPAGGGGSGGSISSRVPTILTDIDPIKLHAGIDSVHWNFNAASTLHQGRIVFLGNDDNIRYELLEDKKTRISDNDFDWEVYRWKSIESIGTMEAHIHEKTVRVSTHPGYEFSYEYNGVRANPYLGKYGNSDELIIFSGVPSVRKKIHFYEIVSLSSGVNDFGPVTSLNSQGNFVLPGTFDGVHGLYKCYSTPSSTCAIKYDGLPQLGYFNTKEKQYYITNDSTQTHGNYWVFQPGNVNDLIPRTIKSVDIIYRYGWWLHKPADGESNYFADAGSSFSYAGLYPLFDIEDLSGTATYIGGAAGVYAFVHGNEGGDATNFTARARLTADFDSDKITGVIDDFKFGPGGRPVWSPGRHDWSVQLMENDIQDLNVRTATKNTMWTISGHGFGAGGEWGANFPVVDGSVIIGSFSAVYGAIGRMVGGFSVEREE